MRAAVTVAALALALAACGSPAGEGPVVFAAASLAEVLPRIEPRAQYSFDGSSGLVDQLAAGAPADVFASADRRTMDRAVGEGLIDGEPRMFATNHLVLVVPTGNPAAVTGFDASLDGAKLVVCAPEVPCG
ncbi:substrate-binding domain-containing protein, partial [Tessaracoccus lubricantis]